MTKRLLAALLLLAAVALGAACETTYDFDEVEVGGDESRALRPKTNSQWLRALYTDLLGRAPETYDFVVTDAADNELVRFPLDEQTLLINFLDGVGDPTPMRALIAAGLVGSEEVELPQKDDVSDPAAFIAAQFRRFLGREPSPYELATFLAEWDADAAVNPRTVVRAIVGSREYQGF